MELVRDTFFNSVRVVLGARSHGGDDSDDDAASALSCFAGIARKRGGLGFFLSSGF